MGNNPCKQDSNAPNYKNICSPPDTYTVPNLCRQGGNCEHISPEWALGTVPSGGCKCIGVNVTCKRTRYDGDPKTCCSLNYDDTETFGDCFSDTNQKKTCNPSYRNISGNPCRQLIENVCVNSPNTVEEFENVWLNDPTNICEKAIQENVKTKTGESNPEGIIWANRLVDGALSKYFKLIGGIQPEGTKLQNKFLGICQENPSACQNALTNECSGFDRQDLGGNVFAANFCGCHMQSNEYSRYQDLFGVSRDCDPVCSRPQTVKRTNSNGKVLTCNSGVCIIDNVTIDLANSQSGNINFQESCGACTGSTSCDCQITGITIEVAESKLGGINFQEKCKGDLGCYKPDPNDPNGPAIKVDCNTGTVIGKKKVVSKTTTTTEVIYVSLGAFIFVIIILTLLYMAL